MKLNTNLLIPLNRLFCLSGRHYNTRDKQRTRTSIRRPFKCLEKPASIQRISYRPVEVFVAKLMGDNLRQSGPFMAAIDGPARPSMAAMNGPAGPVVAGDDLWCDSAPLRP